MRCIERSRSLEALAVFLGMLFGFAHHTLDLFLGEATGSCNRNFLFAPGRLVTSRDIENAVGVDVESHLNLRYSARGRSNAFQAEATQALVLVELLIDPVVVTNKEVEIRYVIPTSVRSEQIRFCPLLTDYFMTAWVILSL